MNNEELCSCGSGKQSKACCSKNNVIPFRPINYDVRLKDIHDEIINFAINNYEAEIDSIVSNYIKHNLVTEDRKTIEIYANLLISWILINEPIIGQETVVDLFIKRNREKVKNSTIKEKLALWSHAPTSIFEVKNIDHANQSLLHAEDLLTGNLHTIHHPEPVELGECIIGTLLPFVDAQQFMFLSLIISQEDKVMLNRVLEMYDLTKEPMTQLFPEWFSELVEPDQAEVDWADPIYIEVADLFIEHLERKEADLEYIQFGLLFWNVYSRKYEPKIRKIATFSAALDYFVATVLSENLEVTQVEIAKEYGVSPNSVSNHYKQFMNELDEFLLEHL